MQISELAQGISARFENSRIVFWYDPEHSFTEALAQLDDPAALGLPADLCLLNISEQSILATKRRIELDEPNTPFLLYFPYAEPEPEQDWLLDIRLYSEQFFADHSSMLLNELGIPKMALRSHIRQRKTFFGSKQRLAGLKKWVTENEDEQTLDRKMIAVVTRADSAGLNDILLSLLREHAKGLGTDNPQNPETPLLNQISKFGLEQSFWSLLETNYGYKADKPSFSDFVLKLFCTDFWTQIAGSDRDWLLSNVLKTASGKSTALAFMVTWRDSRTFTQYYDSIASNLSQQLEMPAKCRSYHANDLIECETFETVEQTIIRGLVNSLLDSSKPLDRPLFQSMLSKRLQSHWTQPATSNGNQYRAIYQAIQQAETLLHLRSQYVDGFHYDSAGDFYKAYAAELYQFDQAYRLFNEHVLSVMSKGADILRQLDDEVESLYTHWYLPELGLAWDRRIGDEKLMDHWQLPGIPLQHSFYEKEVRARLVSKKAKRVFVVISDALRYEVAQELSESINGEKRFQADISSQLGVLPSYTQLGMAALLPHKTLSYSATSSSSAVCIDGQSSQGLENRHNILQAVNGMAVSAKELMGWSNQEGRDRVRDAEIVYIYHDTIDAIGDKAATEEKTFEACRDAINELKDLVGRVINRLNASRVLVTADHGFLFQQKALAATDKTALQSSPADTVEAKKRYIVGDHLPSEDACWKGKLVNTAHGDNEATRGTEFLLPRADQRFHFVGGARFVHGGAMLQEICIPLITVKALQKEQAVQHQKQPVGVVIASQPIKIVNNIDKVRFLQTDPVGQQFIPRQLDIVIMDDGGQVVSSRETITFDSTSPVMDQRVREVQFKLIGSSFSRDKHYALVLENVDTRTEYNRYSVTIDLAFQDDF